MKIKDMLPPSGSAKFERSEVIQLHCTPEERAMIAREAAVRAGGNVDAFLLGVVKFGYIRPRATENET